MFVEKDKESIWACGLVAKEFCYEFAVSKNIVDLRSIWERYRLGKGIFKIDKNTYEDFINVVTAVFHNMGLNLRSDSEDDRVRYLCNAIDNEKEMIFGFYDLGDTSPVVTGIYRILSACDPTQLDKLVLRPAERLLESNLLYKLNNVLFDSITAPLDESLLPKLTAIKVVAPSSPFWGFGINTRSLDRQMRFDNEPDLYVEVPSGLVSRQAMRESLMLSSDEKALLENNLLYFPRTIAVQGIYNHDPYTVYNLLDTESGLVSDFLDTFSGGL